MHTISLSLSLSLHPRVSEYVSLSRNFSPSSFRLPCSRQGIFFAFPLLASASHPFWFAPDRRFELSAFVVLPLLHRSGQLQGKQCLISVNAAIMAIVVVASACRAAWRLEATGGREISEIHTDSLPIPSPSQIYRPLCIYRFPNNTDSTPARSIISSAFNPIPPPFDSTLPLDESPDEKNIEKEATTIVRALSNFWKGRLFEAWKGRDTIFFFFF